MENEKVCKIVENYFILLLSIEHKRNPILILPFIMLCRLDVFKIGGKHSNENLQSVASSSSSSLPCRHEPSQSGPMPGLGAGG